MHFCMYIHTINARNPETFKIRIPRIQFLTFGHKARPFSKKYIKPSSLVRFSELFGGPKLTGHKLEGLNPKGFLSSPNTKSGLARALYSERPKSEHSDFGHSEKCSYPKRFGFRCCLKSEQNHLVCQTQNQFQTGLVPNVSNRNVQYQTKPNVPFSDVDCIQWMSENRTFGLYDRSVRSV